MNQWPPASHTSQSPPSGTLLWIGNRSAGEFRDAFEYCESLAPQVATRIDIDDCLNRPAAQVAGIVITRQIRQAFHETDLQTIRQAYPDATMIQLLGSLCAGERPRPTEPFGEKTIYWHQWNQHFPTWLRDCGVVSNVAPKPTFSVAIVASDLSSAQPLMDLAAASDAAAIWCKHPNHHLARNVDAVWWDESAAQPTTVNRWQDRIAVFDAHDAASRFDGATSTDSRKRKCRHVWLASWPRREDVRSAIAGGVELVISKPYEISLLEQTIEQKQPVANSLNNESQTQRTSRAA